MNRERLQDVLKDVQIEKYDAAKSPDDREWSSQWPVQAPFNPYLVPLPIRCVCEGNTYLQTPIYVHEAFSIGVGKIFNLVYTYVPQNGMG